MRGDPLSRQETWPSILPASKEGPYSRKKSAKATIALLWVFNSNMRVSRGVVLGFLVVLVAGASVAWRATHKLPYVAAEPSPPHRAADPVVAAARKQIGVCVSYDAKYRSMTYPNGDVEPTTGVCTDVVIRALRLNGKDLQKLVHEDIVAKPAAYPKRADDTSIDHRRVPNLRVFLGRQGKTLPTDFTAATRASFQPGDIVTWKLPMGKDHIGLVSDKTDAQGWPLVIHNIGKGTREEDVLGNWELDGHYRYR